MQKPENTGLCELKNLCGQKEHRGNGFPLILSTANLIDQTV